MSAAYTPSPLEQLQLDMLGRIQAHAYFSDVYSVAVRPRSSAEATLIQTNLDRALNGLVPAGGKSGTALYVNMPVGNNPEQEVPGPELQLIITVRIIENPVINMSDAGTGQSAEDLMLSLLNLIDGWFIQDMGSTVSTAKQAWDVVQIKDRVAYDVRFEVKLGLEPAVKAVRPKITGDSADGVMLTTPTPGALIYYTIDGSYPTPANSTAVVYPAFVLDDVTHQPVLNEETGLPLQVEALPIPLATGTTIRAVAYAANLKASDLAAKQIN